MIVKMKLQYNHVIKIMTTMMKDKIETNRAIMGRTVNSVLYEPCIGFILEVEKCNFDSLDSMEEYSQFLMKLGWCS